MTNAFTIPSKSVFSSKDALIAQQKTITGKLGGKARRESSGDVFTSSYVMNRKKISKYKRLDAAILSACKINPNPRKDGTVIGLAARMSKITEIPAYKIMSDRLNTLRTKGLIVHLKKEFAPNGIGGWYLC